MVVSAHSSKAGSLVGTMVGIAHVVERRAVTAINRVQISILTPGTEAEVVEVLDVPAVRVLLADFSLLEALYKLQQKIQNEA